MKNHSPPLLLKWSPKTKCTIECARLTGQWLTVMPSILNGTELSALEFRDSLNLRYSKVPPGLPPKCDGCGSPFTTEHAHSCKVGGRVIHLHDNVTNKLKNWCTKVLSNSRVWNEPSIFPVSPSAVTKPDTPTDTVCNSIHHHNSNQGDRGDLLVRGGLWDHNHH